MEMTNETTNKYADLQWHEETPFGNLYFWHLGERGIRVKADITDSIMINGVAYHGGSTVKPDSNGYWSGVYLGDWDRKHGYNKRLSDSAKRKLSVEINRLLTAKEAKLMQLYSLAHELEIEQKIEAKKQDVELFIAKAVEVSQEIHGLIHNQPPVRVFRIEKVTNADGGFSSRKTEVLADNCDAITLKYAWEKATGGWDFPWTTMFLLHGDMVRINRMVERGIYDDAIPYEDRYKIRVFVEEVTPGA